jgi:iron complex outermembrane receptor protein
MPTSHVSRQAIRLPHVFAMLMASTALVYFTPGVSTAQQASTELEPVILTESVNSSNEKADGPVKGYVAQRSASATKSDTPLVETPVSVSVVTADQISDQGAGSVAEALNYTAGAFGSYRGASNLSDEVQLRGFGERTAVPKFLDGLSFGTANYGQLDSYYFERIEVVKGPNSVAYGQVTPGGMINMVSKRPTAEAGNDVEISIGSDDYRRLSADLQGVLNPDGTLRYRLVGSMWEKNLQGALDQNRLLIAPSLTWEISPDTEVTFTALYQREPDAGQRGFFPKLGVVERTNDGVWMDSSFVSYAPDYDYIDRTTGSLGYQLTHNLGYGWELSQSFRYTKIDMDHSQVGLWSASDDGAGNYNLYVFRDQHEMEQYGFDTSIHGEVRTGEISHKIAVGVDHAEHDLVEDYARTGGGVLTFSYASKNYPTLAEIEALSLDAYVTHTVTDYEQTGIYVQDQMDWGRWSLMLGARYDWTETSITEDYNTSSGTGTDTGTYKDDVATGRVAISYKFANGLVPYLSYSTSFEPVKELDDNGEASFSPEKSRQWELGAKWASADGRMLLTGALFDIRKKNITESVTEAGVTTTEQVGSVRSKGVELEAHAQVSDRLSLIASYFHTDAYYETGDYKGNQYYAVPLETVSLWAKYGISETIDLSLGLRHVGSSWANDANTYKAPGYNLVDAGLSADLGAMGVGPAGLRAAVSVTNFANKRYVSSCVRNYCWLGEGRAVKATLTYAW